MTRPHYLILALSLVGCGNDSALITPEPDAAMPDAPLPLLTDGERAELSTLSPLRTVPADTTNAYADNATAARLGQMLFFDKSYAGPLAIADDGTNGGLGAAGSTGKVSCASCHAIGSAMLDDRRSTPNNVSLGTDFGTRNALGIINSSFYTWTNWGGRFDSQWSLPLAVAESPKIMNSTRLAVAHLLYDKYRTEYAAAFGTPLDARLADTTTFPASGKPTQPAYDSLGMADKLIVDRTFANYGKAIAAYMRTLISRDAPFDRFAAGDDHAISMAAVRGFKVFVAKGCNRCHTGPHFTDNKFHALGVAQTGPHVPASDLGRSQDIGPLLSSAFNVDGVFSDNMATHKLDGLVAADPDAAGQFRTNSLRNVAAAGPYMHAGQLATLADVVVFYDRGGDPVGAGVTKDPLIQPLGMSSQERSDLVAFLESLTGTSPPIAAMVDTSK